MAKFKDIGEPATRYERTLVDRMDRIIKQYSIPETTLSRMINNEPSLISTLRKGRSLTTRMLVRCTETLDQIEVNGGR